MIPMMMRMVCSLVSMWFGVAVAGAVVPESVHAEMDDDTKHRKTTTKKNAGAVAIVAVHCIHT